MAESPQGPPLPLHTADDRLDSWKEIATFMRRDVKTVQRWEKREGMPVHRHQHDKIGSVYAFRSELERWAQNRRLVTSDETAPPTAPYPAETSDSSPVGRRRWPLAIAAVGLLAALGIAVSLFLNHPSSGPLANAKFVQLTDFIGIEQAAAISGDGRLVAFLSDRDGQMDVWVTQVGSGEFHNLTRGRAGELVNPSVRTLDFSPDDALVTFWTRRLDPSGRSQIDIWAVPVLGGSPHLYLEGVAEYDWSNDSSRLVYHTPGPGDPMFVRDAGTGTAVQPKQIFSAPEGQHGHFPLWSPDRASIYFVQGTVPDRMDIWRLSPTAPMPEQVTHHNAAVTYPVFIDQRTLLYLVTEPDGSGPWMYALNIDRRIPQRASFGLERYTSLAASRDGRRLVATAASPKKTLLRLRLDHPPVRDSEARPIALSTGNGSAPRLGNGFLVYVSSAGNGDGIWKLQGDRATQLWSAPDTRVIGGPSLAMDGRRVAFSTKREGEPARLWVVNSDGTNAHVVTPSLEVNGAPAWSPDDQTLTVGALVNGIPNLYRVATDGRPAQRLIAEYASDPAWSSDGDFVVYSGADVGTTFKLRAIAADGQPRSIPDLTLTRGARHIAFRGRTRLLLYLRGDMRQKNLWEVDLDTGAERQLTDFAPGFAVRDFDVAPDGSEVVIEQEQEQSDIVLLALPPR